MNESDKDVMQQALKVLKGCLEHPDAADAIAALEAAITKPTSADYAQGYCEGFNDACKPAQPVAQKVVAWMTEDGRVATDITKQSSMSTPSKAVFNIPLYTSQAIAQPI